MTFTAILFLEGKTATGFEVPVEVVDGLNAGKRPAVRVTLNGAYAYRSTVSPYGGKILLPVAAEHREAAGLKAGDSVEVTLEVDTEPRVVEVPADLKAALEAAGFTAKFAALSYSGQRAHVLSVTDAKTPETRLKRVEKVVATLKGAPL